MHQVHTYASKYSQDHGYSSHLTSGKKRTIQSDNQCLKPKPKSKFISTFC